MTKSRKTVKSFHSQVSLSFAAGRLAEGEMSAGYLYLYDDGKWLVYGLYNVAEWVLVEVKKATEIL